MSVLYPAMQPVRAELRTDVVDSSGNPRLKCARRTRARWRFRFERTICGFRSASMTLRWSPFCRAPPLHVTYPSSTMLMRCEISSGSLRPVRGWRRYQGRAAAGVVRCTFSAVPAALTAKTAPAFSYLFQTFSFFTIHVRSSAQ